MACLRVECDDAGMSPEKPADAHNDPRPDSKLRVVGVRVPSRGGLVAAAALLDLVIRLRGDRPFIPKGIHRFTSFEESGAWSLRMMARQPNPDRQP